MTNNALHWISARNFTLTRTEETMSICVACPRQQARASLSNTATTVMAVFTAMTFSREHHLDLGQFAGDRVACVEVIRE
jgi:hypothetical protein